MSKLTRRDFFRRFRDKVTDHVELPAALKPEVAVDHRSEWQVVGRLADMTPGKEILASIGNTWVVLRSDASGVWAVMDRGVRGSQVHLALQYGKGGLILANPAMEWPRNRVLSHATGEAIEKETVDGQQ